MREGTGPIVTTTSSTSSSSPLPPPGPSHRRVVFYIAVVAMVFGGMVSVVYYHSQWKIFQGGKPATALIVVEGTPELDGAVVVAEQYGVPMGRAALGRKNNYVARLRLHPGEYTIRLEQHGRMRQHSYRVREYEYLLLRLGKATQPPTTRPPTTRSG